MAEARCFVCRLLVGPRPRLALRVHPSKISATSPTGIPLLIKWVLPLDTGFLPSEIGVGNSERMMPTGFKLKPTRRVGNLGLVWLISRQWISAGSDFFAMQTGETRRADKGIVIRALPVTALN